MMKVNEELEKKRRELIRLVRDGLVRKAGARGE